MKAAVLRRSTTPTRRCACGGIIGPSGECDGCRRRRLQRQAAGPAQGVAPRVVRDVISSPGQPLDAPVRASLERGLQHDFSRVRVHTDARAAESAAAVSAAAYAVGEHVAFARGRYAPETPAGLHLLAHELTHVRQQAGPALLANEEVPVGRADSPLEREAGAAADAVLGGTVARVRGRGGRQLQRHPEDLVAYTGGQSGRVLVFAAGQLAYVGPAISGHAGHTEWEKNVGPTPTGNYAIHPGITRSTVSTVERGVCGAAAISSGYQEITATTPTPCEAGSAHYCNVSCPTARNPLQLCWTPRDCWGPKRIRIEGSADVPKRGGGTVHRDGFYLHGGNPADPVSSGCVKSMNDDAFDAIRRLTGVKGRVRFCVGSACPESTRNIAAAIKATEEAVEGVRKTVESIVP